MVTRRDVIKYGLGTAGLYVVGCSGLTGTGTGVRNLDTPNQILSNPFVSETVDRVRSEGNNLNLWGDDAVNPPVISGRYDISGRQFFPGRGPLSPGTFTWSNQTSDNHIDTFYSQTHQSGTGTLGEIIRGNGSSFTVYSILRVDDDRCNSIDRYVLIWDGRQHNDGSVGGLYVGSPVNRQACLSPSGGSIELSLTGPAKAKDFEGLSLIGAKE